MLENIRENSQGPIAKIILGLVILTFALAGIGSYTNSVDTSVAEVNGEKISQADFDKAYQNQRNRMAQQFGDMFETLSADATYMANFRNGVLDNLINQRLLDQSADTLAIRVSDAQLKKAIREMPEFQVDGVFDNNRYLAIINQAGFYQSSDFRDYLRIEMIRRQLSQALVASEFNLPYQEALQTSLQNQKRDVRFATIDTEQFKSQVEVTEQEIKDFYANNQTRYQNAEKAKVDYLVLDVAEIAKGINVTDADVASYYQDNIDSFKTAEQRRIAHILVEFNDDEEAAQKQAEDILAKVNAGEDFAELAKELSADTFSGENGGDLDWMEAGTMDPAFDDAAFALPAKESVSEVVKTEFGYHIIKVLDIKPEVIQTLADVKEELFTKVSENQAQEKFFELQQEMARLSFEFPDTLDDAAAAIDSAAKTSDWLSRGGNLPPFNDPRVLEAVFSDLVLEDQVNSDVIEVSDSLAVVVRLNEYQEATVKPLTEVEAGIKTSLIAEKATEKAQTVADELLAKFKAGENVEQQLSDLGASFESKSAVVRNSNEIETNIANDAFVLPHPEAEAVSAGISRLNNGNLALVEVQAVTTGDDQAANPSLGQQQTSQLAQSAYSSYIKSLKVDAKITRRTLTEESSPL